MYTGPHIVNDNLVFGYDTGYGVADNNTVNRFYLGKPTTNTWNKNTHSYTDGNITATRNATPPVPPPIQGFEVYKLVSNDGGLNQGIMGTSNIVNGVGGNYVHSVYCYLESGTTVTVGQHWHPWSYGGSQTPPIGKWVRLFQTVTNAVSNYGEIANAYRTNGVAYFTAPQYELGSVVSPHVDGTRSSTQSLIDLTKTTDIDVSNVSFDSTGQPTFDGTDDYISKTRNQYGISDLWSVELVFEPTDDSDTAWNGLFGGSLTQGGYWFFHSAGNLAYYEGSSGAIGTKITYRDWNKSNTFTQDNHHHLVITYTPSSTTAGTFNLYYNGGEKTDSFSWTFGWNHSLDSRFIGSGDGRFGTNDVRIYKEYSKALTAAEVKQNYNAYKNRFNI